MLRFFILLLGFDKLDDFIFQQFIMTDRATGCGIRHPCQSFYVYCKHISNLLDKIWDKINVLCYMDLSIVMKK